MSRAGASAYYFGGAVLYTRRSRRLLTTLTSDDTVGMRSSSPPYAALLARHQRERFKATWGLAETGAAGLPPLRTPWVEARGDVERYRIKDAVGRRANVDVASVSLVFPFGRAPERVAAAPVYVAPAPMPAPVAVAPAPAPVVMARRTALLSLPTT